MRGVPLLAFTKTCANGKALVRRRTLCEVFDRCPLSNRTTAAHLAAFILPSRGRLPSLQTPLVMGAISCERPRWTCTPIIVARDPVTLAQIGARSVPWRLIDAHSKHEMTAIAQQLDGHWEGCWTHFWIAARLKGTMRLTSHARVLRVQGQTQEENHSRAIGSDQRQAIRYLHPSAYRSWERLLSQRSLLPLPRI